MSLYSYGWKEEGRKERENERAKGIMIHLRNKAH